MLDTFRTGLYPADMHVRDIVAPLPFDRFEAEVFGQQPVHIPAGSAGRSKVPIDWARMNALLALRSHWSKGNIELVLNSRPVLPDLYLNEIETLAGRASRADPSKVQLFLGMGASLVANSLEDVSPKCGRSPSLCPTIIRLEPGPMLIVRSNPSRPLPRIAICTRFSRSSARARRSGAFTGTGRYRRFSRWRAMMRRRSSMQSRGRCCSKHACGRETCYIPRGFYHDALATSDASLHVTLSLAPLTARYLFRLLEELAIEEPEFREYLPDARVDGSRARRPGSRICRSACRR